MHYHHHGHYVGFSYKWTEQRPGSDTVNIPHMVALEIVAFIVDEQWL